MGSKSRAESSLSISIWIAWLRPGISSTPASTTTSSFLIVSAHIVLFVLISSQYLAFSQGRMSLQSVILRGRTGSFRVLTLDFHEIASPAVLSALVAVPVPAVVRSS